ncbi:MAG: DUF2207 domain-containing protein [Christensenellales bacterium]|jgi:uncharacterized membrane protein YgcG
MKKRIAALCGLLLLTTIFFSMFVGLQENKVHAYDPSYRYFTDYSVNIDIQENNVYNIQETIVCDYTRLAERGHGIVRSIPTSLNFQMPDGQTRRYRSYVNNLQVDSHPYSTESSSGYLDIYIGDPDAYASGIVTYQISYQYDIGDLGVEGRDFVYFNIIGTNWNADIAQASFTVTLPKAFDSEKVWAFYGAYGHTSSLNTVITDNTISGETRDLAAFEGITLQVDLPADYFVGERSGLPASTPIIIVSVLLAAAGVVCWFLFGRDKQPIPVVNFSPPDGLDPAQLGYIADNTADNKDLSALVIYWADQGLLRIDEIKKGKFSLTRLASLPDAAPKHQQVMWEGLFKSGDTVELASLKENFYTTMQAAISALKLFFSTSATRLYTKKSTALRGLFLVLMGLPLFLAAFSLFLHREGELVVALFLGGLMALVFICVGVLLTARSSFSKVHRVLRLVLPLLVLVALYGLLFALLDGIKEESLLFVTFICSVILLIFGASMRRHTPQGQRWIGDIMGFRNFIVYAEKDRILQMVNEDPQYFYHILPYAHVLGVTDKWAKNFDQIGITPPQPDWYGGYYGGNLFTTALFLSSFNRSMNSMNTHFTSRPPSSSGGFSSGGGGFGGGGFSGGGFGGGGGGGW